MAPVGGGGAGSGRRRRRLTREDEDARMRQYVLYIVVAVLAVYAWRDWFVPCCALVVLMAVMQHEDMPKSIAGIQGLNLWNVLLASVIAAWAVRRWSEGLVWDMPGHVMVLLGLYAVVIGVGVFRMLVDRSVLEEYPLKSAISEELINTFKWVIPGLLIYDGCRTRRRLAGALASICLLYVLLAGQVVRRMPPSSVWGGGGPRIQKLRLKTCAGIGYSVPDMSTILAGGSWVCLAAAPLCRRRRQKAVLIAMAVLTLYGQLLTGGRAGYLAWAVAGLLMCTLRWRKGLILAPIVPVVLLLVLPGTAARMLQGFDTEGPAGAATHSEYAITSGRNLMWPHVIEKIKAEPLIGYGRGAMVRTGLRDELGRRYGIADAFPHPHNIYLEWLLDNGVIGLIPVLIFYGLVLVRGGAMFRDRANPWCAAAGGMALAAMTVQLVAGIGSQHFYPRESTVAMWAAAFVALRVWVESRRAPAAAPAVAMLPPISGTARRAAPA